MPVHKCDIRCVDHRPQCRKIATSDPKGLKDVSVHRGAARGMSDHYLIEAIVRLKGVSSNRRVIRKLLG